MFVGVVSDSQWLTFCEDFGFDELLADTSLRANNDRVAARERIIPIVQARFRSMKKPELMEKLEASGLPFAPIARPEDLFDDEHLNASDGLLDLELPDGTSARLPALPLELGGRRFGKLRNPPGSGEHTAEVLREAGYSDTEIEAFAERGVVSSGDA